MINERLTEENFLLYAARHYDNPSCIDIAEFEDDLNTLKYIKRLLTRYQESGELKERLILNHLNLLNNLFGPEATVKMCLLKMQGQWHILKPFLVYLKYMPEIIYNVGNDKLIRNSDIPLDTVVVKKLREFHESNN
jgi:hypothetical protein